MGSERQVEDPAPAFAAAKLERKNPDERRDEPKIDPAEVLAPLDVEAEEEKGQ
jgi:hypothetical protein